MTERVSAEAEALAFTNKANLCTHPSPPPPQPAAKGAGVPSEILNMASKIGAWAMQQGWKDWEIGYVADRKLVTKLQARAADLTAELAKANEDCFTAMQRLTNALDEKRDFFDKYVAVAAYCARLREALTMAWKYWSQGKPKAQQALVREALAIKPASALTATSK